MAQGYYDLDGTIRTQSAAATLDFLRPHLEKMGITRVALLTQLDFIGIEVASCMRPASQHLSVSQGKGLNKNLAIVSALMESIESFHMENPKAPAFISPCRTDCISPTVFNTGKFSHADLNQMTFAWAAATRLLQEDLIYIPHVLTELNTTQPTTTRWYFNVSSNGIAAGNTSEEALCHALYEVIERDALMRWQMTADKQATLIDLHSISSPLIQSLLDQLQKNNIVVKLWDISSALHIPAFHCAIIENNPLGRAKLFTGSGAHLSRDIAATRAITEAVQCRLTFIGGSRDDVFHDFYEHMLTEDVSAIAQSPRGTLPFDAHPSPAYGPSFTDDIANIKHRLNQHHFNDIFVVDHTKPELGIPVLQVIIPGLLFNTRRI